MNEIRVQAVTKLIIQSTAIIDFIELDSLEEEIKILTNNIKITKDKEEIEIDKGLLEYNNKRLKELLKTKTKEEIYKNALFSYSDSCKLLFQERKTPTSLV